MTAPVLARPTEGRQRAGQPNTRGPVVPARRTPGPRIVWLDKRASVQFAEPIRFLVVRSEPASTVDGWVWIEGYQLDVFGDAVEWRRVFVCADVLLQTPGAQVPMSPSGAPVEGYRAGGVAGPVPGQRLRPIPCAGG